MRLTTKGRFAVTAMIDLALHQQCGPVSLAAISQRQKISLSYLEQLFGKLRRRNIVESVRGPGGGYHLARPAQGVTVAEVIFAVNEALDATQCGGKGHCNSQSAQGTCMTHDLWATLSRKMVEYLDSVSLQDLVNQHQQRSSHISYTTFPVNALAAQEEMSLTSDQSRLSPASTVTNRDF